jgi:hypothetical protein
VRDTDAGLQKWSVEFSGGAPLIYVMGEISLGLPSSSSADRAKGAGSA